MARLPHYHYSFFELITSVVIKNKWTEIKEMEEPGFEPGALYMRSTRETTTPHSRVTKNLAIILHFYIVLFRPGWYLMIFFVSLEQLK